MGVHDHGRGIMACYRACTVRNRSLPATTLPNQWVLGDAVKVKEVRQFVFPDVRDCSSFGEEDVYVVRLQTVGNSILVGESARAVPLLTGTAYAPVASAALSFSQSQTVKFEGCSPPELFHGARGSVSPSVAHQWGKAFSGILPPGEK